LFVLVWYFGLVYCFASSSSSSLRHSESSHFQEEEQDLAEHFNVADKLAAANTLMGALSGSNPNSLVTAMQAADFLEEELMPTRRRKGRLLCLMVCAKMIAMAILFDLSFILWCFFFLLIIIRCVSPYARATTTPPCSTTTTTWSSASTSNPSRALFARFTIWPSSDPNLIFPSLEELKWSKFWVEMERMLSKRSRIPVMQWMSFKKQIQFPHLCRTTHRFQFPMQATYLL
jgi:hypothetical protein